MARIRALKIGFFHNEELAAFPYQTRLLFEGLWLLADREGRLKDQPKWIKSQVFPFDDLDVEPLLDQLAAGPDPFIQRYTVNGRRYLHVIEFKKHQRPHHTEPPSTYPPEPSAVANTPEEIRSDSGGNPVGREGKGREEEGNGVQEGKGRDEPPAIPLTRETTLSPAEIRDLEIRNSAPPATVARWAPPEPRSPSLVDGHANRQHAQHAVCFRERGLCVTRWVHDELVGKYGGKREDAELVVRQFYRDRVDAIPPHEQIGEPNIDRWWRAQFAQFVGFKGMAAAPTRSKAEQMVADGQSVLAAREARRKAGA